MSEEVEEEATVGIKRKGRENRAAVVAKKRVVEDKVLLKAEKDPENAAPEENIISIKSKAKGIDSAADLGNDYVLITNKKKLKASKPKAKPKTPVPTLPLQTCSSFGIAEGVTLLPSVTPPLQKPTPKARPRLTVDTSHEPKAALEVSSEETAVLKKQSLGWFSKILFFLLGIFLSMLPFLFFRTFDTLALASLSGQSSVMRVMFNMGADKEVMNKYGETLLLEACRMGNNKAVQLFLDSGLSTDSVNKNGETSLAVALRKGDFNMANLLIKGGAKIESRANKEMDTYLLQAVRNGNYLNANFLIRAGANLEAKSKAGESPLVIAFRSNQLSMAKLLLNAGADKEIDIDGETLLNKAVFYDNKEKVKLLLNADANVEAEGKNGLRPLLQAAINGNQEITQMLLSKRAHTEAKNKVKWPLIFRYMTLCTLC